MPEYKLPDVGEGLTEAELVTWKVAVGDEINVNDIVCDIETAKSIVELPSPFAGTVTALLVEVGATVEVGSPIIAIAGPGEVSTGSTDGAAGSNDGAAGSNDGRGSRPEGDIDLSNPAASGGGEGESLVGRAKAERGAVRRVRRRPGVEEAGRLTAHADVMDSFNPHATHQHEHAQELITTLFVDEDAQAVEAAQAGADEPATDSQGVQRPLAKPPVRKLARDLGVDLGSVTPTGPGGTITRGDVESAAGDPGTSSDVVAGATASDDVAQGTAQMKGQRERREPVKGVRKMMAQAMVDSAFSAPHVTEWITVDVSETIAFVERLKLRREFADVKVSPLLVLARAIILAMRRTPEINSYFDAEAGEVVYKSFVNLGIAAATPRGLIVPNIKDAHTLDLHDLAVALGGLVDTARAGRTQPAEMSGGTFTITNVGIFGVDAGTPIINPGESAILAFGAVRKQPWVVPGADGADELAIRHITTLALSFDHRHVDGEMGSRFLADVAELLRDPAAALLY